MLELHTIHYSYLNMINYMPFLCYFSLLEISQWQMLGTGKEGDSHPCRWAVATDRVCTGRILGYILHLFVVTSTLKCFSFPFKIRIITTSQKPTREPEKPGTLSHLIQRTSEKTSLLGKKAFLPKCQRGRYLEFSKAEYLVVLDNLRSLLVWYVFA